MRNILLFALILIVLGSCKQESEISTPETIKVEKHLKQVKEELTSEGFELFDYIDEKTKDTIIMQKYFVKMRRLPMAF